MPIDRLSINLIARGDQKKFRQLIESTSDELFLFALSFLRKKEVAEEIVSDVFVKTWENRSELGKINNLKAYLFVSVKNACLSHLRKEKNNKTVSIDGMEDFWFIPVEGPENEYIDKESLEQINKAIDLLPPKCKLAFTLAKINGLRYREIAGVMNVSEKTVNNHLVYAIKKITATLGIKNNKNQKTSRFKQASIF
ncbi:MAG TPA: RNA polymerase sigma-70 factor [Tangfeifania sp.]|nr:RNA polymerase sigma-70 factor [Tangfeifania sp.]